MHYIAVRVVKQSVIHTEITWQITWQVTTDGIEEPDCDVGLLTGDEENPYNTFQHKNKEYEILGVILCNDILLRRLNISTIIRTEFEPVNDHIRNH